MVLWPESHHIHGMPAARTHMDKLTSNRLAGTHKLMPFVRCNDKHLDSFLPESECQGLKQIGFSCSGTSEDGNIGILILAGVKEICVANGTAHFIDPDQYSILIADL